MFDFTDCFMLKNNICCLPGPLMFTQILRVVLCLIIIDDCYHLMIFFINNLFCTKGYILYLS